MDEYNSIQLVYQIKTLALDISQKDDPAVDSIKRFQSLIERLGEPFVQNMQPLLITTFLRFIQKNSKHYKEDYKCSVINCLTTIFLKTRLDNKKIFFNIYGFLLKEIYDPESKISIKDVSEEYKLEIMKCITFLAKSLSWDLLPDIYVKENVTKLSVVMDLALKLAKHERYLELRISAVECILAITKLEDQNFIDDIELRLQISNVFAFFLPGIATGLLSICIEDEKTNHKIIAVAIRAWGRLISLLMQNYQEPFSISSLIRISDSNDIPKKKEKLKSQSDIDKYLDSMERSPEWYQTHDTKLAVCMNILTKLATHSHPNVRKELLQANKLLVFHCFNTMPKTISRLIEILSALSEDEYEEISKESRKILNDISNKFLEDDYETKMIIDELENNFYNVITKIPRIFNGLDEREQIMSLNLLIGYLNVFGKHKLKNILFTEANLTRLILSLIHIAQLEKSNISLLEEYALQDFETEADTRSPWKTFHFREKSIQNKLEQICHLLATPEVGNIILDYLIDIFINDEENRKEATLLLNEILASPEEVNYEQIKNVIYTYLEFQYWDLPVTIIEGINNLNRVQNNIIQICLQLEGIGKMALVLQERFEDFLLKVLYSILEKAGSNHPLLSAAGLSAMTNISIACGYKNVTDLINKNTDYFSYNVIRKLKREEYNESVLNVLGIVIKYSSIDVLISLGHIIEDVLMQCCDKYQEKNINSFLRVFAIFVKSLHKWFNIRIELEPMKTREEKRKEEEDFRISNLEELNNDFSDNIMGKTVDEMYEEDMKKSKAELEDLEPQMEEYKKPDPPLHISLTVSILKRSLNFLPSKNRQRKILVLEILKDGVEILKDWEDELLPIVHQIWSPLIGRFKEYDSPLIINLSFQLLLVLARLSKDFIRSRTVKDILPFISEVIKKQAKESYLKDIGSAYRYSQGFKMQITILPQLERLAYYIDVGETNITTFVDAVDPYLSNLQPVILQEASIKFFASIKYYDTTMGNSIIKKTLEKHKKDKEWSKNLEKIEKLLDQ